VKYLPGVSKKPACDTRRRYGEYSGWVSENTGISL
jgi:hypothetical protein